MLFATRRPTARLARGILAMTFSAAIGLLLSEIFLTIYHGRGPGEIMALPESPYLFTARHDTAFVEDGIEYQFNNLGMRRTGDVTELPEKGTTRILSYGDSIANGWAVPADDTYANVVELELNRRTRKSFEVLNMYRGVSPTLASFHIRRDVPRLRPHGVILLIELLNDVSDEAHLRVVGRDPDGLALTIRRSRYIVGWDGQLLAPLTVSGSLIERTKTWTALSRIAGELLSLRKGHSTGQFAEPLFSNGRDVYYYHLGFDKFLLSEQAIADGFDRLFESARGIERFLQRHDIRFLLVILPSRFAFFDNQYRDASLEVFHRAQDRAGELDLSFISLFDLLRAEGGERLFLDFCHPTASGNRAIASALYPVLSRW